MSAMKSVVLFALLLAATFAAAQESNPELKKLVEEDQAARTTKPNSDWMAVLKDDAKRRVLVRKMIDSGKLHTAEDYYGAAAVFQHGSEPDDFLLAHSMAMIATAKGEKKGLWLAAVTLDRYLQSKKQPQIYGTQFTFTDNSPVTQQPYNKSLITDELRKELGVSTLAVQDAQLKQLQSSRPAPSKK
jgi:hypothetical protein